ncbi:hypothetical protein E2542_SST10005 [Spatholobus suberectus]|nr:hypothetical protein E2542_SST10005 [Spatholobus suberectus]
MASRAAAIPRPKRASSRFSTQSHPPHPPNNNHNPSPPTISSAAEESESSRSDGSSATARAVTTTDNNNEEEEALPEKVDNNDEVDNHVETESEGEGNENAEAASFREGGGDSNCLDLLIEAARVISEKDESDSEGGESRTRRASREKRKERWVVVDLYADVAEEREPVVRSKRGRNQALPYRFRDSVVEPLKRATRSQRPSSTSHLSKRLLRSSPTT